MKSNNWLAELFNWRFRKFLSVGYIRVIYLVSMISLIIISIVAEYLVAQAPLLNIGIRILMGFGIFLGAIFLLLIIRVSLEIYVAIFYIEDHLRFLADRKKSESSILVPSPDGGDNAFN